MKMDKQDAGFIYVSLSGHRSTKSSKSFLSFRSCFSSFHPAPFFPFFPENGLYLISATAPPLALFYILVFNIHPSSSSSTKLYLCHSCINKCAHSGAKEGKKGETILVKYLLSLRLPLCTDSHHILCHVLPIFPFSLPLLSHYILFSATIT